jgi:outer membrane protein insertion porin family
MMHKRLALTLSVLLCFLSALAHSQQRVKVLVLPFEIYASETFSYLKTEIPGVLERYLEEAGAEIAHLSQPMTDIEPVAMELDEIRKLGQVSGADQVIWGSLTWIGEKFSLDAKMINTFSDSPPAVFYQEGEGVADLSETLNKIVKEIRLKLFRQEKIVNIVVEGNNRIEAEAIKARIDTKPGDIFLTKNLTKDIKSIYAMGYFEDVRVESENRPDGKVVIFEVTEKPTIRVIHIFGNKIFEETEILENMGITTGSILNLHKINRNIERIRSIYKEKNFHDVQITYEVTELENNQADLEFHIVEGEKSQIKTIAFEGNESFTDKRLKKLMQTSEKNFLSWLTASGTLKKEDLDQDMARIHAFYQNHGFIQTKVGEPQIEFKDNLIYITIKIDEGPQFKVGRVDIEGDLVLSKDELLKKVSITQETHYNREVVRNDVLALTDLYSDEGYAYADIAPEIDKDMDNLLVDITYTIDKGNQVYFERIIISGNTKTRDKVIRRELEVHEQELYSGKKLKRGVRNLYRLEYFEDIKIETEKGSTDDSMVLEVDVKEKATGSFSFGGGFSSVESVFLLGSIGQRNLFGRGQKLVLSALLGGRSTRFSLSFTEPWLFDIPLSFGVDLFNWERDYDDYDKDSKGGGIRFSYPIFQDTRLYLGYLYEDADIDEIDSDAARSIKELEGRNVESSIKSTIEYDTRNRLFNTTEGQKHAFSIQYAGLGFYFPLFWETVGYVHTEGGFINKASGGKLPDYEKFYLGGINSIRGFDWRDICLTDEDDADIGGQAYVQLNLEYIFPLVKKAGLTGLIFYDTGNVYEDEGSIDLADLRESVGGGIRWYSPMGPIRLEYGHILDREGDEDGGRWEFSMGNNF